MSLSQWLWRAKRKNGLTEWPLCRPVPASELACNFSVENACFVIALGVALAFPPGFLMSALGVKNLVFNLWRGRPRSPIVSRSLWGSVWGLPHFHSTLNTVKICVWMYNRRLFMGTNRTFVCVPPYMHVLPLANLARGFSACAWPCRAKQLWYVFAARPPIVGV